MDFLKNIFTSSNEKQANPQQQQQNVSNSPLQQTAYQVQQNTNFGSYNNESTSDKGKEEKLMDLPIIRRITTEDNTQENAKVDHKKMVTLSLDAKYQNIKKSTDKQILPVMISVIPASSGISKKRVGLDIVIVIDISGSMGGEKIKLVVETLLFIIDEMQEIDRVSLIAFDDCSEILTNLTPMTQANKDLMKKTVLAKIHARGSTNIVVGLKDGFDVLLKRKEVNDVTAMFFLSDGQDTCGNDLKAIERTLIEHDAKMLEKGMAYKINSFGYGEGHDEKALGLIANQKEGNFYYIKSLQLVDECFIDCMGFLMSIFATQAEITLFMNDKALISKKFGTNFSQDVNQSKASIKVGNIALGLERNYILYVEVPSTDELSEIKIISGILNFVADKQNFMIESNLVLKVVEEADLGKTNTKVEQNILRVEAAEVLKQATEDFKKGDVKEARSKLMCFKSANVYGKTNKEEEARMDCLLDDNLFDDEKNVMENEQILSKQAYRPMKACYQTSNSMQKDMIQRKKK